MPSLRQPVGPLPASIYWRRRLVVLAALIGVAALVAWLATGMGSGSKQPRHDAAPPQSAPAQSITPGASPTGSAITGRGGGTGGGELNLGGPTPSTDPTNSAGPTGSAGATSGGAPAAPPVNTTEVMALPVCTAGQLALELAGSQNSYQPKDKPRLALTVRNTSGSNCRVDLGRTAATITVTSSTGERIWSSGDCPTDRQAGWVQITAGSGLTDTFNWDRSRSKPQCASTDGSTAQPGNYLVQADVTGPSGGPVYARTSIRLES